MNKIRQLQIWMEKHIRDGENPYFLDKDQAKVVLDTHLNTLVTARAGSGKTRTIVAKIIYLITYQKIPTENIIVFAFNRKAKEEINSRLALIQFDNQPIFTKPPKIATTFHAFAYHLLQKRIEDCPQLVDEQTNTKIILNICKEITVERYPDLETDAENQLVSTLFEASKQFINRAEQEYFDDYQKLLLKIKKTASQEKREVLNNLFRILKKYHLILEKSKLINFNLIMSLASKIIKQKDLNYSYQYIFVDEFQDFSRLFLNLILSMREQLSQSHLLAVGDDWQAINRFAGSNVEYFLNFKKYFPNDCIKLFIPTNYRSGSLIVKNANYFMSKTLRDFKGCKSKSKLRSSIYLKNTLFDTYQTIILKIIQKNPGKSIKILSRNNDLSNVRINLTHFVSIIKQKVNNPELISESTIHRSKGLESDIVILLEIDANKFPSPDKTNGLYEIFGKV